MVEEITNADGQNGEQNSGENADKSLPSGVTEDVNPAESKDPKVYDETGVEWENRAKEYKRKYEETLEKQNNSVNINTSPDNTDKPQLTEYELEQIRLSREVAQQVLLEERNADDVVSELLNKLSESNPYVQKCRAEIERDLRKYKTSIRTNPQAIAEISNAVVGRNIHKFIPKPSENPPQPVKKIVSSPKDVLSDTGGAGGGESVNEKELSDFARIEGLDISNPENRKRVEKAFLLKNKVKNKT